MKDLDKPHIFDHNALLWSPCQSMWCEVSCTLCPMNSFAHDGENVLDIFANLRRLVDFYELLDQFSFRIHSEYTRFGKLHLLVGIGILFKTQWNKAKVKVLQNLPQTTPHLHLPLPCESHSHLSCFQKQRGKAVCCHQKGSGCLLSKQFWTPLASSQSLP